MPDSPLDNDLVARIAKNLEVEPSARLREIAAQPASDLWSPEALTAARLLLERRAHGIAAEPAYRTTPAFMSAEHSPCARGWRNGDTVLAPRFSLPRGFSALLFLARYWRSKRLKAAKIGETSGKAAYVYFYNGSRGWVRLEDVKPLTLDVGASLYCRWRGQSGIVTHWNDRDEKLFIRFEDGQGDWVTLAKYAEQIE